jgi:hypothetical protein
MCQQRYVTARVLFVQIFAQRANACFNVFVAFAVRVFLGDKIIVAGFDKRGRFAIPIAVVRLAQAFILDNPILFAKGDVRGLHSAVQIRADLAPPT